MKNGEENRTIHEIYLDFMSRIAKFDELVNMGSKLLAGFQQALGFLGRPSIEKSALLERIMQVHGTQRFLSYVEAGCMNSADSVKYVSQLQTCHIRLKDNVNKAKIVLTELKCLLDDAVPIVQLAKEQHVDGNHGSVAPNDDEDLSPSSRPSKPEVVDYAAIIAFIYSMVKQDYTMQEMIVSSLSLKSSQGELDTYCQMWSLRPYIDDDIMHQAWTLIR